MFSFRAVRFGFCRALELQYNRLSDQHYGRVGFLKLTLEDLENHQIVYHTLKLRVPALKFYCKGREVGKHIVYAIESILKQKIDSMQAEAESCHNNSTSIKEVELRL